jgi:hypothetical protein
VPDAPPPVTSQLSVPLDDASAALPQLAVFDDADAPLASEAARLGGAGRLGQPISGRFWYRGFVTQAFSKLVLQWRPDLAQAVPLNVFDELHEAGADAWLDAFRQVPPAADWSGDAGLDNDSVYLRHVVLLDAYPALRDAYLADPNPIDDYGLPLAVGDYGTVISVRLQRAVLQLWTVDTPSATAGTVTLANGGDIAYEAGLWTNAAAMVQP